MLGLDSRAAFSVGNFGSTLADRENRATMRRLIAFLLLTLAACSYRPPGPRSVAQFQIAPLPRMVGTKVQTPLYLVVVPAEFPDTYHVTGHRIGPFTIEDAELTDVRTFATRDLRQALGHYFATVTVVDDPAKLPPSRHVMARVQLRKIEIERRTHAGPKGEENDLWGAVEWGFGLKMSDEPEFSYTFADRSPSAMAWQSGSKESIFASALQEALRRMLADYAKTASHQKLVSAEALEKPAP